MKVFIFLPALVVGLIFSPLAGSNTTQTSDDSVPEIHLIPNHLQSSSIPISKAPWEQCFFKTDVIEVDHPKLNYFPPLGMYECRWVKGLQFVAPDGTINGPPSDGKHVLQVILDNVFISHKNDLNAALRAIEPTDGVKKSQAQIDPAFDVDLILQQRGRLVSIASSHFDYSPFDNGGTQFAAEFQLDDARVKELLEPGASPSLSISFGYTGFLTQADIVASSGSTDKVLAALSNSVSSKFHVPPHESIYLLSTSGADIVQELRANDTVLDSTLTKVTSRNGVPDSTVQEYLNALLKHSEDVSASQKIDAQQRICVLLGNIAQISGTVDQVKQISLGTADDLRNSLTDKTKVDTEGSYSSVKGKAEWDAEKDQINSQLHNLNLALQGDMHRVSGLSFDQNGNIAHDAKSYWQVVKESFDGPTHLRATYALPFRQLQPSQLQLSGFSANIPLLSGKHSGWYDVHLESDLIQAGSDASPKVIAHGILGSFASNSGLVALNLPASGKLALSFWVQGDGLNGGAKETGGCDPVQITLGEVSDLKAIEKFIGDHELEKTFTTAIRAVNGGDAADGTLSFTVTKKFGD